MSFESDMIYSYLGGFLGGVGDGLGSYASTVGIGGISTMLTNTCTFFQSVIEYCFFEAIYTETDYVILIVAFISVIFSAMQE
jgi:hypothetical protein